MSSQVTRFFVVKGEAHHYYNENVALDQKRKKQLDEMAAASGQVGQPAARYGDDEEKEEWWPDKADFARFMANRKKQQEIYGAAWAKVPGIDKILKKTFFNSLFSFGTPCAGCGA